MLAEERYIKIKEIVDKRGSASVGDLMAELDASESTIRRSLQEMDRAGLITRVHGGAVSKDSAQNILTIDRDILERKATNTDDKTVIGKYAASLIEPGDFVYIDSGSTTEIMAQFITQAEAIYVTNCVAVAKMLGARGLKVFLLGGEFKITTEAIVGEEAVSNLEKYNFTKGFFGTNGVDIKRGFTTPEMREGVVKREAMLHSKYKYVLADSSKFGAISSINFCKYEDASVITTGKIGQEFKNSANIINI